MKSPLQVKRLAKERVAAAKADGKPLTQNEALNQIAQEEGYMDWQALKAAWKNRENSTA